MLTRVFEYVQIYLKIIGIKIGNVRMANHINLIDVISNNVLAVFKKGQ
jgi:hypothetical protein